jgi:hypothetical protein
MGTANLMRRLAAATSALFVMVCAPLAAQDLEPRAYSNSPIGLHFVVAGYAYSTGKFLTDPSLPVENVSIASHVGVLGGATVLNILGQSAKLELIIPYVSLGAKGEVFGKPHARYIDGFSDPLFRFSMNFIGAPALTAAEFSKYRQNFILGGSIRIGVPLGQYDDNRLVNVGSNRWSLKPEIGFSKAFGGWTVELAPAVTFYTDNGDFFGGKTREQAQLYSAQAHVSYTFAPGFWLGLDAAYFNGGRTTVDDVENDDRLEGTRFGVTLALPLNRYHSIKLYAATGYNADRHHDFEGFGIAWQTRWGGGY